MLLSQIVFILSSSCSFWQTFRLQHLATLGICVQKKNRLFSVFGKAFKGLFPGLAVGDAGLNKKSIIHRNHFCKPAVWFGVHCFPETVCELTQNLPQLACAFAELLEALNSCLYLKEMRNMHATCAQYAAIAIAKQQHISIRSTCHEVFEMSYNADKSQGVCRAISTRV